MRVFKNRWFVRFARKERISDADLLEAIERASRGLVDADLGGNVIKQRISRPGQGRSGGYRAIIVLRLRDRAFFVFGFSKSTRANIDAVEVTAFKQAASHLLNLPDETITALVEDGSFTEIESDA